MFYSTQSDLLWFVLLEGILEKEICYICLCWSFTSKHIEGTDVHSLCPRKSPASCHESSAVDLVAVPYYIMDMGCWALVIKCSSILQQVAWPPVWDFSFSGLDDLWRMALHVDPRCLPPWAHANVGCKGKKGWHHIQGLSVSVWKLLPLRKESRDAVRNYKNPVRLAWLDWVLRGGE